MKKMEISSRVCNLLRHLNAQQTVLEGVEWRMAPPPAYTGEEPFHDTWMANEGKSFDVRLALAQSAWYASVRPQPEEYQLIIGGILPSAIITYPTGVFDWDFRLQSHLAAQNPRGKEIVEYWSQYLSQREAVPSLPPEYNSSVSIVTKACHSSLDYSVLLEKGLSGVKALASEYQKQNSQCSDWYEAVQIHLDGVGAYILSHAKMCEEAANEVQNTSPQRAAEYRKMAENCYYLAQGNAPNSFWQACQFFWFLFYLNGHDSPGRIDQYLFPALQRDLERQTLTEEEAQEITDCLYCKIAKHIAYGSTIGGQTATGEDATNRMTWMCLSSISRLRLLSPRTALRVHRGTPPELLMAATASAAEGVTYPTFVNDEVVVPGMKRRGASSADAFGYTFCGCGQVIPAGCAYGGYEDIIFNISKALLTTLHRGRDEQCGGIVGRDMGPLASFDTYEKLEAAVLGQISYLLDRSVSVSCEEKRWCSQYMSDPLRSVMIHNCLEKGVDFRRGGAQYHDGMVDALGLTTLADSMTAIRIIVYEKKVCTLEELVEALDKNWEGYEPLRQACLQVPKFGNNDEEADRLMVQLVTYLNEYLFAKRTYFGGHWGINILGWSGAVIFGKTTGATPNGRKEGDPLADCAGPSQGMDKNGLTSVLLSMAKLPMDKVHGPLVLSVKVSPKSVQGENVQKLVDLIRAYFAMGGMQLQFSVVSLEEMREAQKNPEKWEHLLVRVGGFSAKFVELTPEFQADMIRRTENEF